MKYRLKQLTGGKAIKILEGCLLQFAGIEADQLTTLELNILSRIAENPPRIRGGAEEHILNA